MKSFVFNQFNPFNFVGWKKVGGDGPGPVDPQTMQELMDKYSKTHATAWYDNSDMSTMFQDASGTVPVTAYGQKVMYQLDKSGQGNHRMARNIAEAPKFSAMVNFVRDSEFTDFNNATAGSTGEILPYNFPDMQTQGVTGRITPGDPDYNKYRIIGHLMTLLPRNSYFQVKFRVAGNDAPIFSTDSDESVSAFNFGLGLTPVSRETVTITELGGNEWEVSGQVYLDDTNYRETFWIEANENNYLPGQFGYTKVSVTIGWNKNIPYQRTYWDMSYEDIGAKRYLHYDNSRMSSIGSNPTKFSLDKQAVIMSAVQPYISHKKVPWFYTSNTSESQFIRMSTPGRSGTSGEFEFKSPDGEIASDATLYASLFEPMMMGMTADFEAKNSLLLLGLSGKPMLIGAGIDSLWTGGLHYGTDNQGTSFFYGREYGSCVIGKELDMATELVIVVTWIQQSCSEMWNN